MSGITGIIGPLALSESAESAITRMAGSLDGTAVEPISRNWVKCERLPVRLAWARKQHEPECLAWNERRDVCLIFTGEDFDSEAKLASLRLRGHSVHNLVEGLLLLYQQKGTAFLSDINGRFAGAVLDLRSDTLLLFNDRYGLNRIYVHASSDSWLFSSEAKSILALQPDTRRISQRSLAEVFSLGCVLQNRSLFNGVTLLPPASQWTFSRGGSVHKGTYFDPRSWENQEPLDVADYSRQLSDVFGRIAPKYLHGSARVGMSLTGGLDSRMILAWAKAPPGTLPCYTFGGPIRDCADVTIARELARVCGQPHTTLRIEADFFGEFLQLAEKTVFSTDGTMDVSGAVELHVNRRAREIAPIRLTGNYGSEILRSNIAFRPARLDLSLFTPEFKQLLAEATDTYRREAAGHRLSFIAFKQVPWHHYSRFAAERSQLTPRSPFLDNELVALAYRAPRTQVASPLPLLELITRGNPALDAVRTDRALSRHPVPVLGRLQREWREFTAKAEYAYDYGMPRWLVRTDAMLKPLHLERLFLGRHKFYHFRIWYRDRLAGALRQGEFDRALSCYVEGAPRKIIEQHISGRYNRTLELHKLLTVHLVERLFAGPSCQT